MTTLDDWLVAMHVICAVIWVGGAFYTQMFAIRAQGTGAVALGPFAKDTEFARHAGLPPGLAVLLLASGIWLITPTSSSSTSWNVCGLVVIAISIVNGAGFLGPESGRIGVS